MEFSDEVTQTLQVSAHEKKSSWYLRSANICITPWPRCTGVKSCWYLTRHLNIYPILVLFPCCPAGGKADQGEGLGVHVERAPGVRADLSLQPGHGAAGWSPRQAAQAQQGTRLHVAWVTMPALWVCRGAGEKEQSRNDSLWPLHADRMVVMAEPACCNVKISVFVMEINLLWGRPQRWDVVEGEGKLCSLADAVQGSQHCSDSAQHRLFVLTGPQVLQDPGEPEAAEAWHWWGGHCSRGWRLWHLQPGPPGSLRGNCSSRGSFLCPALPSWLRWESFPLLASRDPWQFLLLVDLAQWKCSLLMCMKCLVTAPVMAVGKHNPEQAAQASAEDLQWGKQV